MTEAVKCQPDKQFARIIMLIILESLFQIWRINKQNFEAKLNRPLK